jgi:hypothetical protein
MPDPDFDGLPDHPALYPAWTAVRLAAHHFSGIPEVRSMETLKSPAELRDQWSNQGLYENGVDWEGPLPNWHPGLKVEGANEG